jgi:hypothetical protein
MPGAPGLSEITATTARNRAAKASKRKPAGGYRAPAKPARKALRRSK